ncbi:hypothetical protein CALCODRAFT_225801 [Calocera cornea HHB12733]|uniref:Uncharacterized protein n=1 Tax=Calocera cornea HHB12733 TaxID=1353952 RepID=A0A165C0U2_9BASI|nr:hypothetical protein CALCODRAFT_225801 [Calocera cornea HHB12733]
MTEERELSLALPRSHADVRQDEVEDLAEKIRSILFGRACWLPYQEADVEALPEQDPFGAKLLESLQAMETAVLEQHLRSLFPSLTTRSGPGRDTEITGRRRDVEKCRRNVDVLLAMADEDPSVFKPNPQNPCQAERTVSRLRLRRFAVNWLLYRPSALPKPKPPADKRRYIDDCLHLKLGEKDDGGGGGSGQMAPGYQLKRFPVIIRFWDHLVSFVQHFRHGLEALEQSLISTPSDINAGLTVSGQPRPVGGPDWASDATLSVVDILHERTEAGKSQRAVGLRSTVLFFQLIKVSRMFAAYTQTRANRLSSLSLRTHLRRASTLRSHRRSPAVRRWRNCIRPSTR